MKKLLSLIVCLAGIALAQLSPAKPIRFVVADPSGACTANYLQYNTVLGTLWGCATTWTQVGGGATVAFSNITAGTNAAALVVGTGGSLATSGSGTITATAFSGILPGANGGTANGFFAVTGPATSLKTFTFPNASATVLTTNALVTGAQGGVNNGFFEVTGPATSTKTFTFPNASATVLTTNALVTGAQGGVNNAFFEVTGPTTSTKTFTFPNASATVLTDNAAVTGAQGGTGVANTSKTITLGGNLTTSGGFTTTLTVTANTSVTLPTSGTLLATITNYTNYSAATCQAGACAPGLNTPTTLAPAATAVYGTNTIYGVLDFPDTAGVYNIQGHFRLPLYWTGTMDLTKITWRTSATSGSVVWQLQTACIADAETGDPSFNAAQTVTDAAKGTTLQWNDAAIASVTVTGCSADEEFFFKFIRDNSHASDNLAATAQLIGLQFAYTRTQ